MYGSKYIKNLLQFTMLLLFSKRAFAICAFIFLIFGISLQSQLSEAVQLRCDIALFGLQIDMNTEPVNVDADVNEYTDTVDGTRHDTDGNDDFYFIDDGIDTAINETLEAELRIRSDKFSTDLFTLYLRDIESRPDLYSRISHDQEINIANQYRETQDSDLKIQLGHQIINANLRFVIYLALQFNNKYKYLGVNLMDLIQSGNIGLLNSLKSYDPAKASGVPFVGYASKAIRQQFRLYLGNLILSRFDNSTQRILGSVLMKAVHEADNMQFNDKQEYYQYISDVTKMPIAKIVAIFLSIQKTDISLSQPIWQDNGGRSVYFGDMLPSLDPDPDIDLKFSLERKMAQVLKAVAVIYQYLSDIGKDVINFNLLPVLKTSGVSLSQTNIADKHKCAVQNVNILKIRLIKRLTHVVEILSDERLQKLAQEFMKDLSKGQRVIFINRILFPNNATLVQLSEKLKIKKEKTNVIETKLKEKFFIYKHKQGFNEGIN